MDKFTGFEYILIDIANNFGLDKAPWQDRLDWAYRGLQQGWLPSHEAKKPYLYEKALQALKDIRSGQPSGHLMGFDACSSGIQIMSAIMRDPIGATNTGLIDTGEVPQIYGLVADALNENLGTDAYDAAICKSPVMTHFYGSRKVPKEVFGEDTDDLQAFYQALTEVAPGATELMQDLLDSWQPFAEAHSWVMPDNFHVVCRVKESVDLKVEIDELDHATCTHRATVYQGIEYGLSNAANVVHSIDGFIVRELLRRCNYDRDQLERAASILRASLFGEPTAIPTGNMVSLAAVEYLDEDTVEVLSLEHRQALLQLILETLQRPSFQLLTVHDDFRASPAHMNWVRQTYAELLAELSDSNLIDDILSQIYGYDVVVERPSARISDQIRNSNYSLS